MEIVLEIAEGKAIITLSGKLTINTSPDLDAAIKELPVEVCDLDVDVTDVDYVASAGLRVLVAAKKLTKSRGGTMRLLHPCEAVMDVLETTGLIEAFEIEQ